MFPLARKLVIKTHWHILYVVLSPLTLYWVLRGDEKQKKKKSSCTNNENKAKVCMHRFHTVTNRAVPDASVGSGLGAKASFTHSRAWCVAESVPDKPEKPINEGGRAPQEKGFRTKEPPRPVGPKNAPGAKQGWSADRSAQGHGKGDVQKLKTFVPSSPLPSLILSVCSEWMFSPPEDGTSQRGVDRARPGITKCWNIIKSFNTYLHVHFWWLGVVGFF